MKTYFLAVLLILTWNITSAQFFDDYEAFDDSTYYTDGNDIIWLYGEDTGYIFPGEDTSVSMEGFMPDNPNAMYAWGAPPLPSEGDFSIGITPGHSLKVTTKSIFGLNLADIFNPGNLPDETSSDLQWGWLKDLKPQSLHIPSGMPSTFAHLLPYRDLDHDEVLDPIKGLGYDIFEIARYYDRTDGEMDYPSESEILNDNDIQLADWIDVDFINPFKEYRENFIDQQFETMSYLEQFVTLVHEMQAAYSGYDPKVIVCLNILSETAEQNRVIIDFLINEEINVEGIELGNECYDKFFCNSMGFQSFDDYYEYILGDNVSGFENVFQLEDETYLYIKDHHDYISTFRGANFLDVKIGLVGKQHPASSPYPLRMSEVTCTDENWNVLLRAKYGETVTGYSSQKIFDAVIIHSYFDTYIYGDYLLSNIEPSLICSDDDPSPYYDPWWFDNFDPRLYDAFRDIRVEIKDFIKTGYVESYDAYNEVLDFNLSIAAGGKELWPTEWNLKTSNKTDYDEGEQNMVMIMSNNFMNGVLLQEWWLKNLKIGFRTGYRPGFMTNATYHSFSGGVWEFMLTPATTDERIYFDVNEYPYELDEEDDPSELRNYYVKRTSMYIAEIYSEITKKGLFYLPSNFSMLHTNPNLQPTVFINLLTSPPTLYVYYTNVSGEAQNYKVFPSEVVAIFEDAIDVELGVATIKCIQASKPYSTSGKSKLYSFTDNLALGGDGRINVCYASENPDPLIEIDQIYTLTNDPECTGEHVTNGCITVPPYSAGYFAIPLTLVYAEKLVEKLQPKMAMTLYPNPTGDYISIFNATYKNDEEVYDIEILNAEGVIYLKSNLKIAEKLDVSKLVSGTYQMKISRSNGEQFIKTFIKI